MVNGIRIHKFDIRVKLFSSESRPDIAARILVCQADPSAEALPISEIEMHGHKTYVLKYMNGNEIFWKDVDYSLKAPLEQALYTVLIMWLAGQPAGGGWESGW